ncbi:MAG TPA: hypothetical protein PKZ84_09015 [Anaerolineae bacterium]|nr:hypothetical protein [Anaerolineae bacterium]HQI84609.1 hypothetical protein [Anaerolineae bacterium]
MDNNTTYTEKVSSSRTEILFIVLALFFLLLFVWRVSAVGFGILAVVFLVFCGFFAFYALNYRTLIVQLSAEFLTLKFGVFTWKIPLEHIEACALDDISLWRIGGARIHFSFIRGRYRAMFNFLEHPRVVVRLKTKKGAVQDVAFSTRQPERVLQLLQEAVSARQPRTIASGDWTLQIYFRNRGTRSEGQHGVLLHKGKPVESPAVGVVIETDLGQMRYYGQPEGVQVPWGNTGWNFADEEKILPSWSEA